MPIFNVASTSERQGRQAARFCCLLFKDSFEENTALVRESQGPTPSRKDLVFSAETGKLNCVNDVKTGLQSLADQLDLTLLLNTKTSCNVPYLKVVCGVGRQVGSAVVVGVVRCHLWP